MFSVRISSAQNVNLVNFMKKKERLFDLLYNLIL